LRDEILSLLVVMMQRSDLMKRSLTLSAKNQHKQRASLVLSRNNAGVMRCSPPVHGLALSLALVGELAAATATDGGLVAESLPVEIALHGGFRSPR
jgi:hypothetical protein